MTALQDTFDVLHAPSVQTAATRHLRLVPSGDLAESEPAPAPELQPLALPDWLRIFRDPTHPSYGCEVLGDPKWVTRAPTGANNHVVGLCPRCHQDRSITLVTVALAIHHCYGGPWYVFPLAPYSV